MKIRLEKNPGMRDLYDFMSGLPLPYNYTPAFEEWQKSFLNDNDGDGRTLFSSLTVSGAYLGEKLIGFIQYGRTAFGFDENGELSDKVSYPVIRSFYFSEARKDAGLMLLNEAITVLSEPSDRIYAFFHYFGMSCYARHGKLSEKFGHIHDLLIENGFSTEHENVFYSSRLSGETAANIKLNPHGITAGGQQYFDFILNGNTVGGCEIHFLEQKDTAYLRWIFINENLRGSGIGSESMAALKTDLFKKGIRRFDTDTALTNTSAQRFYEKNDFLNEGLTRSYYVDL